MGKIRDEASFVASAVNRLDARAALADVRAAKLDSGLYEENYDATRFMLHKLEETHQTRETRRDLWVQESSGKSVFTFYRHRLSAPRMCASIAR